MTYPSDLDSGRQPPPFPPAPRLALPVSKPFVTYILLVAIGIVWFLMETVGGGSTNTATLIQYGANSGPHILFQGQTWRLFTSMFLHIGLMHLGFNAYALFIFGFEMEGLYGPDRYTVIYILAGIFGSLVSLASRGPAVLSAGASGAIFGVIGMNLAFFLLHRQSFGQFGRQRVSSTLVIIGVNLLFGFTIPGIDNMAHIGGLVAGFALGYGLAPRYQVVDEYTLNPRVIDRTSLLKQWWVPALAIIILVTSFPLIMAFWLS